MKSTLKFVISLFVPLLLLSGCGFKLKGQYYLPDSLQTIYVTSTTSFTPLAKQLILRLRQNNVIVSEQFTDGNASILLHPEQFQRQTLSLLPNGQIAEYNLIYQVKYDVTRPGTEKQTFQFELSREFQDDPNNALAKQRERELILNELRVIASERILAQLTTLI